MARVGAPRIAKCEQNVWRSMCGPLLRSPARRPARRTKPWTTPSGQRRPVILIQDSWSAKVPMLTKCRGEPCGQRHVPQSAAFRRRDLPLPRRPLHADLPLGEVEVAPFERDHLAEPQPSFARQQHEDVRTRVGRLCSGHGRSPPNSRIDGQASREERRPCLRLGQVADTSSGGFRCRRPHVIR